MNVLRTLLIAVVLIGISSGFPGMALAQESVGTITEGQGEVVVIRASGGEDQAVDGTVVYQHDQIYVGPGGEATIVFVDQTVLTLGAESALTIDELVYDPDGQNSSASFDLAGGLMGLVSGDIVKSGDMTVTTPVSTIGIRGTAVLINTFTKITRTLNGGYLVEATGTQGEVITLLVSPDGTTGSVVVTTGSSSETLNSDGTSVIGGQLQSLDATQVQDLFGPVLTALQRVTNSDLGVLAIPELEDALEELLELLEENPNQDDASPD